MLVDGLTLPDPNDRHVLAPAVRCHARVIVTSARVLADALFLSAARSASTEAFTASRWLRASGVSGVCPVGGGRPGLCGDNGSRRITFPALTVAQ
jgi:hypothetical protein